MDNATLIALDWGTSNLRASLLDAQGRVLDRRSAATGVMAVTGGAFEPALRSLCQDWMAQASLPLIASGMIGSRQGWVEVPYLPCPATPAQAAAGLKAVPLQGGGCLHIVPGLRCDGTDAQADVMRGEETQIWGVDLAAGNWAVLPGTHSKWARVGAGGAITSFQTYMTGELFAVLQQHSILGRLMKPGVARPAAFDDGVRLGLAQSAHLLHLLFSVRTAGLVGAREGEDLPDYLSGLLLGAEVGSMRERGAPDTVTLLGEPGLVDRYRRALALAGIGASRADTDATIRGQWRLAMAAGLVGATG
ncbi:MAG: 2-dehydro-3-deoxygalactonokinase [Aquabacterium sp.]